MGRSRISDQNFSRPAPAFRYAHKVNDAPKKRAREVTEVMSAAPRSLTDLLARARRLDAMDQVLAGELDERYAPHVRVANVRDGALILATPVAPIATRLRMESGRLLEVLQRAFPAEFNRIEILVTPDLPQRE